MDFSEYRLINQYFCDVVTSDITIKDLEEYQLSVEDSNRFIAGLLRYPPNHVKVFKTILKLELTEAECKNITRSSSSRYPDEDYKLYKQRIKTKQEFEKYATKVLVALNRSTPK